MTFAVRVTFDHELEPYSDEEGKVRGRVDGAGFNAQGTEVTEDLHSVVVYVDQDGVMIHQLESLRRKLGGEDVHWSKGALPGVEDVSIVHGEDLDTVYSAAVAHREE